MNCKETVDFLIQRIAELCDTGEAILEDVKKHTFHATGNQIFVENILEGMQMHFEQLRLHTKLGQSGLTKINFYKLISDYFYLRKNKKKRVSFFIQYGFDGEMTKVSDVDILNDCFTIDHCLPLMGIVPVQIANNAYKYMPEDNAMQVELLITPTCKFLTFSNYGPHFDDSEKDDITDFGVRGKNAEDVVGSGLGLSQIKTIIDLHREWLDSDFDIENESTTILVNDKPYSMFHLKLSFDRMNLSDTQTSCLADKYARFQELLPDILIHNNSDIISGIIDGVNKLIKVREKEGNEWKEGLHRLKMKIGDFQETTRLFDFVSVQENHFSSLLGRKILVKPMETFTYLAKNIQKERFPELELDFDGKMKRSVEAGSSFYMVAEGLLKLLFENLNGATCVYITFYDNEIEFSVNNPEKFHLGHFPESLPLTQTISIKDLETYRLCMYKKMLSAWGLNLVINNNKVTVSLL